MGQTEPGEDRLEATGRGDALLPSSGAEQVGHQVPVRPHLLVSVPGGLGQHQGVSDDLEATVDVFDGADDIAQCVAGGSAGMVGTGRLGSLDRLDGPLPGVVIAPHELEDPGQPGQHLGPIR